MWPDRGPILDEGQASFFDYPCERVCYVVDRDARELVFEVEFSWLFR